MLHCLVPLLLRLVAEVVGHPWHDAYALWLFEETKTFSHNVIGDFVYVPFGVHFELASAWII